VFLLSLALYVMRNFTPNYTMPEVYIRYTPKKSRAALVAPRGIFNAFF